VRRCLQVLLLKEKRLKMREKEVGGNKYFLKLMGNTSIVYYPPSFSFSLLNKQQTIELLKREKNVLLIKPKVKNPFYTCFFDLSYECNLKCVHCHNAYNLQGMGYEQQLSTLDQIFDLGVLHISFGGGEPTLYPHLLDILKYTTKHTSCSFVTNGALIDKKFIRKIRGLVAYVGVSLDGFRETHKKMRNADIFDKVIDTIKILKNEGILVRVTTTPTKINFRDLPQLGEFIFNELKVDCWKMMKYIPEENRGKELSLNQKEERWLYEQLNKLAKNYGDKTDYYFKINCPAGKSVFSIYANGNVSPCGFMPCLISGNVLKTPLIKILRNGTFFRILRCGEFKECLSTKFWRGSNKFSKSIEL